MNLTRSLIIGYDMITSMKYSYSFQFGGRFVIETKDPAFQDVIGTLPELSFRDIKVINLLYNCGGKFISENSLMQHTFIQFNHTKYLMHYVVGMC